MINLDLLKDRIKESGKTITALSNKIGVSREGLYKKLNGETEFKVSEMQKLSDELQLSNEDCKIIFLQNSVN